jgi:hypothetical protein
VRQRLIFIWVFLFFSLTTALCFRAEARFNFDQTDLVTTLTDLSRWTIELENNRINIDSSGLQLGNKLRLGVFHQPYFDSALLFGTGLLFPSSENDSKAAVLLQSVSFEYESRFYINNRRGPFPFLSASVGLNYGPQISFLGSVGLGVLAYFSEYLGATLKFNFNTQTFFSTALALNFCFGGNDS